MWSPMLQANNHCDNIVHIVRTKEVTGVKWLFAASTVAANKNKESKLRRDGVADI